MQKFQRSWKEGKEKRGKIRELNRLCKANFDLKGLKEKMVLWFISKLKIYGTLYDSHFKGISINFE